MTQATDTNQPLLQSLMGKKCWPPPVWIMRQAGRYLPEYRELRKSYHHFMDLVLDSEAAHEVTMQPLRRFPRLDAAIIFSDILVLPWAIGQELRFQNGHAPKLGPLPNLDTWRSSGWQTRLEPILRTIQQVRRSLGDDKSLIGFAAAPWTLATYMLGKNLSDQHYKKDFFDALIALTAKWLFLQEQAGANVLMLFESWAGTLPPAWVKEYSVKCIEAILTKTKASAPIIVFPRACAEISDYTSLPCSALALGYDRSLSQTASMMRPSQALMGNLHPETLVKGGVELEQATAHMVNEMHTCLNPWIVNLGHGILPHTPVRNVSAFLNSLP